MSPRHAVSVTSYDFEFVVVSIYVPVLGARNSLSVTIMTNIILDKSLKYGTFLIIKVRETRCEMRETEIFQCENAKMHVDRTV